MDAPLYVKHRWYNGLSNISDECYNSKLVMIPVQRPICSDQLSNSIRILKALGLSDILDDSIKSVRIGRVIFIKWQQTRFCNSQTIGDLFSPFNLQALLVFICFSFTIREKEWHFLVNLTHVLHQQVETHTNLFSTRIIIRIIIICILCIRINTSLNYHKITLTKLLCRDYSCKQAVF